MDILTHITNREVKTWGSYGKDGTGPLTRRLIKDISDDHLANIIPFIKRNNRTYTNDTLQLMENEMEYRMENNISVPDYPESINIREYKFFRN